MLYSARRTNTIVITNAVVIASVLSLAKCLHTYSVVVFVLSSGNFCIQKPKFQLCSFVSDTGYWRLICNARKAWFSCGDLADFIMFFYLKFGFI